MQIGPDGFFHLTYCTKIHPGCGWEELFGNLQALCRGSRPGSPRSGPSAWACACPRRRAGSSWPGTGWPSFRTSWPTQSLRLYPQRLSLRDLTGPAGQRGDLRPGLAGGIPGPLHPGLMEILRRLLPAGGRGRPSPPCPLSYKAWIAPGDRRPGRRSPEPGAGDGRPGHIKAADGQLIHLDLEPEPDGLLECSREVADFFQDWLLYAGRPGPGPEQLG